MQYQTLYAEMVGAAERAIEAIEQGNYGQAKQILIDAADDLKKDAESGNYNPVALRYGLENGVWTPESRREFAGTLDHSIHQMAAAFELWDFGVWTPVLQATFYAGLFQVGRAVLDGTFRRHQHRKNIKEIEETT